MDLDFGSGETEAARLWMDLQSPAVPLHNIIVADDAFMGARRRLKNRATRPR